MLEGSIDYGFIIVVALIFLGCGLWQHRPGRRKAGKR